MIDRSRIGVISLCLLLTQITATGCTKSSENLPDNELFVGVIAVEKATNAEPTYSVLAGTSHLPGLDTAAYPDTRLYLAYGRVSLSGGDTFEINHDGQNQRLLPAGATARHLAFTGYPGDKAPDYFLLLPLYSAEFGSEDQDAPFTFNFDRSKGADHALTLSPPPRALLTQPQEGSVYDYDDDFMIGWTVDGTGYEIELRLQSLANGVTRDPFKLQVPVEQGQISFSEIKQRYVDVYWEGSDLPIFGTVQVSVISHNHEKILDSGLQMAVTEVWRQPSSVVITIND